MIPFRNRFHGHNSLMYVYRNGQAVRSHPMVIRSIANPHRKDSRVAVVVSKKILKSAVRRNLIRRRVYEIIRNIIPNLSGVYDIVIIISSSEILNMSHSDVSQLIEQLFDQAGLQKPSNDVPKSS